MFALAALKSSLNYQISSSSGTFSATTGSGGAAESTVTNLSISSIKMSGRPALMTLFPEYDRSGYSEGASADESSFIRYSHPSNASGQVRFYQGSTTIATFYFQDLGGLDPTRLPPSVFSLWFVPSAGDHSFLIKTWHPGGSNSTYEFNYVQLMVMEF